MSTLANLEGLEARLRILVVDDDHQMLALMREVLTSLEVDVEAVAEPAAAADRMDRERFDGIFLDLLMEPMDGFELARRARASRFNLRTPIAIISGTDETGARQKAMEAGAVCFLYKPFDKQQLARLLNTTRGIMLRERRRSKRVALAVPITVTAGGSGSGSTCDVSEGGLAFTASNAKLEPGKRIKVSFQLPGSGAAIETFLDLLHGREDRYAGRFAELKSADLKAIQQFAAHQPSLLPPPPRP